MALSVDSDQPEHSPSLIIIFPVRIMMTRLWHLVKTQNHWAHMSSCLFGRARAIKNKRNCFLMEQFSLQFLFPKIPDECLLNNRHGITLNTVPVKACHENESRNFYLNAAKTRCYIIFLHFCKFSSNAFVKLQIEL